MSHQAAPLFANNWNVYQKIIFKNYMLHHEFGNASRKTLELLDNEFGLTVLDMGCGDAHQMAQVLEGFKVNEYIGYDLAEPVLKIAAENLAGKAAQVVLKQGKMEQLIKEEVQSFDLVYTSYALHHLQDDAKNNFLKDCYQRLNPNGRMIHIDVARKKGQSREAYITDYLKLIREEWTLLNSEDFRLVEEHIQQCDFPASIDALQEWMVAAGFSIENHLEGDGRHSMYVLKKQLPQS
jgi:ubiquinone/menaquinone biosynthesis C-methylase UbiE